MKIYMDACCLCRPFDAQTQSRIRLETEAILDILEYCQNDVWLLAASDMLDYELAHCPDPLKRAGIRALYGIAQNRLTTTEPVKDRSRLLQQQGLSVCDSMHLALAEMYEHDVFLTTDDKLCRAATVIRPKIRVANPVAWFMEIVQ